MGFHGRTNIPVMVPMVTGSCLRLLCEAVRRSRQVRSPRESGRETRELWERSNSSSLMRLPRVSGRWVRLLWSSLRVERREREQREGGRVGTLFRLQPAEGEKAVLWKNELIHIIIEILALIVVVPDLYACLILMATKYFVCMHLKMSLFKCCSVPRESGRFSI